MNKLPLLVALAASSSLFALACQCTMVGCSIGSDEGVRVIVTDAVATYSGTLPATIHVCVESTCADFTMLEEDGEIVCDDDQGDGEPDNRACLVANDKDLYVVLSADMPDTASVEITIEDASGTQLFEDSEQVNVAEYAPNGAMCGPACRTAEVTFTPGAASQ